MNGRRRRVLRLGVALAAVLMLAVSLPAQAAVTRAGTALGPLEADTVYVSLDVHGDGLAARGAFRILHQTPTGIYANLMGDVDCLHNSLGQLVVVTGTIRAGFDGEGINPVGHRVTILAGIGPRTNMFLDVSFVSGHTIRPCDAHPIVGIPITQGEFRLL